MKRPVIALLITSLASSLNGFVLIIVMQDGPDVVITASGSANIDDLGVPLDAQYFSFVQTNLNQVFVGPSGVQHMGKSYSGLSTSQPIGTGGLTLADSGSGDAFGFTGNSIALPDGYISGNNLDGEGRYENTSIVALGIVEQTWTWGTGPNADSAELVIVPEPSHWAIGTGLAVLCFVAYRRRAK